MVFEKDSKTSEYGEWLEERGFIYPHKVHGNENFTVYKNVHGTVKKAYPDKKYMLVTYTPRKSESHYSTLEEAKQRQPKIGHWQILDAMTGDI